MKKNKSNIEKPQEEFNAIELAMKSNTADSVGYCSRGVIFYNAKRYEEAIACYAKAIEINPNYFEAYNNKGVALKSIKKYEEAIESYDKAILLSPNYAEAYSNKGVVLNNQKKYKEALYCLDKAISIDSNFVGAHYNKGMALQGLRNFQEAIKCYLEAIKLDEKYAQAYLNLGVISHELENPREAIFYYDNAIKIDPKLPTLYWNKSNSLLLCGDYDNGLPLYEWRWTPELTSSTIRNFKQNLWLGNEDLTDKTILLHCEQGAGDNIQCIRYAQLVKKLCCRVIVEAPESLVRLFEKVSGIDEIVIAGNVLPEFDFHCPIMSLPLAFRTDVKTIPFNNRYLNSDPQLVNKWEKRLGIQTKLRVGLVWSGSKTHGNDFKRSIDLSVLIKHLPSDVEYVCLQKHVCDEDLQTLQTTDYKNFHNEIQDFADTAALCELMDLIITVDTSVAHLSAGLGKKTWILVYSAPDWRWMLSRSDSPWYSMAELFRQETVENWQPVLAKISERLLNFKNDFSNKTKTQLSDNLLEAGLECFYINLDSELDRRNRLESNFTKFKHQKWNLSRVSAYGVESNEVKCAVGKIRATEKGCFLSHKSIVEHNKNSSKPIMILEDDAQFGVKSCVAIERFMEQWGSNHEWDILFTDVAIPQPEKMVELYKLMRMLKKSDQFKVLTLKGEVFAGATSYILSPSGIKKLNELLSAYSEFDLPYDLYLRQLIWADKLVGVMLFPFVTTISHDADNSQIQTESDVQTDGLWNLYRKMIYVDSNVDKLTEIGMEFSRLQSDKESRLLGLIISAVTSSKFSSK